MKKNYKLLCLILICAIVMPALFACSSGAGADEVVYRQGVTVVLYTIGNVTPEALELVNQEMTRITEAKYSTHLELRVLTESEYKAKIDELMVKYDEEQEQLAIEESIRKSSEKASRDLEKELRARGELEETQKTLPQADTTIYIPKDITYDPAGENQIDILLIPSTEMFQEYAESERLAPIDEELNAKAKVLKEYLYPSLMLAGKYGDRMLAIPTNKMIGEATYLSVNKRLAEKYELDIDKVTDFANLVEFLDAVKEGESNVTPLVGPIEPVKYFDSLFEDMPHFGVVSNTGKTLVFVPEQMPTEPETTIAEPETDEDGNEITTEPVTEDPDAPTTAETTTLEPLPEPMMINETPDSISIVNMYAAAAFTNLMKLNYEFRDKGMFGDGTYNPDTEYAALLRTGTLADKLAWEQTDNYEYVNIMYRNPRATKANTQNSMFAISAATKNVSRTMEILTFLTVNAEFKDLFLYGIEDIHFVYDDNGQVERLNNDYMMVNEYTGNTFNATTLQGENPNKWAIAKEHNFDVINSVFLNFYLDRTKFSETDIKAINDLSEQYYSAILGGDIPSTVDEETGETVYDVAAYISGPVADAFTNAGLAEFITAVKEQTNPAAE